MVAMPHPAIARQAAAFRDLRLGLELVDVDQLLAGGDDLARLAPPAAAVGPATLGRCETPPGRALASKSQSA